MEELHLGAYGFLEEYLHAGLSLIIKAPHTLKNEISSLIHPTAMTRLTVHSHTH